MRDVFKYYEILGVSQLSDEAEIKQKYRDLAKIWHPDYSKEEDSVEKFQLLSVAYDVLSDENSKMFYDVFCVAYKTQPAPDMYLLKIYKNKKDVEDKFLRVISFYKNGKIQKVICSENEAKKEILKALLNVKNYMHNMFDKKSNLQMLLHNALAYNLEKNNNMANIYLAQALEFCEKDEKEVLLKWQKTLGQPLIKVKGWGASNFAVYKFLPLGVVFFVCLFSFGNKYASNSELWSGFNKKKEINYFQKVNFYGGRQTVDDVDLGRIINYPVNLADDNMLYHLTQDVLIKYGPSDNFDTLDKGISGQTVRITGMSPDEVWFRVMVDDGQMGFVKKELLKKGIKNPIHKKSKIK